MSTAVRAVASGRTPDALKGLAKAGFFLNEGEAAIDARECAYVAHRHAGRAVDAARVAIALAWDYRPGTDDDPVPGYRGRWMPARPISLALRLGAFGVSIYGLVAPRSLTRLVGSESEERAGGLGPR